MPPEPLPDRKDLFFFKEKKHERSSSSDSRWRDNHHGSSKWSSADFRRPGHGKQGSGLNMFSEDSGSRNGGGGGELKYARRENKVGFSGQKEWKGQSWETNASPNGNSYPHSDFVNSWDKLHSKEHDDDVKNGGVSNTGQRVKRENSLGLIDWKPLKWTRSGSLSSRGSGFSRSSSSKSMGVDSVDTKFDAQLNNVTCVLSPSGDGGDGTGCIASGTSAGEENSARKKPRLGWGEGLAKYEKKKVDGPDGWGEGLAKHEKKKVDGPDEVVPKEIGVTEIAVKDAVCDGANNLETLDSNLGNVMEKSPSLREVSECASPATTATPSSVACSSSPGVEEKSSSKTSSLHGGACNPSSSICTVSMNQFEGLSFSLENLEHNQFPNLSSSLSELLQCDDPSSVDSGFVRSATLNKLLVWKSDISKTLEVTESEIDLLENELKKLVSNVVSRPSLNVLSGEVFIETMQGACDEVGAEVKDENIDSPGSATSEFVEPISLQKDVILSDELRRSDCLINLESRDNVEAKHSCVTEGMAGVVSVFGDGSQPIACAGSGTHFTDVGLDNREDMVYNMILASNRDSANRASEVFSNLLPTNVMSIHSSRTATVSCSQNELQIKEKFAMRKRFLRFKERVITLKFRAFQHLWKEDLRLLSIKRFRSKAQKKYDLGSRFLQNGFQKHRSSIRSRFSSPAGNLSLVPTSEVISYTNHLLSDSQVKIYRDTLKMPALILDKNERFISNNGLVEDPCAIEKERSMVNPWTPQETEIFLNKLATFGKDFKKIASFLDHKTTADCVEFYYKNHKSDSFQKTKKSEFTRQAKSYSTNTYMVTSGKRWNRETNAASLDMLGAVSEIAANTDDCLENQQKCKSRFFIRTSREYKKLQGDDNIPDVFGNERETAAADVLAGICGSLSSEAMSSCITSSIDPGDWKSQKEGGPSKSVIDDETCSDESCGEETDASDWMDEEKSLFIQAVASHGKDFAMISRCMRTRSRNQCKVFFSKARKCLGLDMIHPEPCNVGTTGANGGYETDAEDAKVSSGCKTEEQELELTVLKVENTDSAPAEDMNLPPDMNQSEDKKDVELKSDDLVSDDSEVEDKPEIDLVSVRNTENGILEVVSEVNGATEDVTLIRAQESEDVGNAISEISSVDKRNDHCVPSTPGAEIEKKAIEKVSVECSDDLMLKNKVLLPVEANPVSTIGEINVKTFCPTDSDSAQNSSGDRNSSLDTTQKPCVISLDQDNHSQASNSRPHDSFVVHHRKALSHDDTSSKLDFQKSTEKRSQKSASTDGYHHQHLPINSLLDCVSSQILRRYPITLSNKNGINGNVGPNEPASSLQSVSNLGRNNFHVGYLSRDNSFLQKCNGSRENGMSELPFPSCEQKQSSPSEVEKPCTSGNVKLFGQILSHPSSQPSKPSCSSSTHEKEDKGGGHHSKLNVGKSFNLKFGDSHQSIDRNSFLPKFEQNNYLSVENNNQPLRSYGFWDGNRIQTGLPSLPDSAILLAKYPAAFGRSLTSTSKIESQPLNSSANNNGRGLNGSLNGGLTGVSVSPTRVLNGSSSRLPEYQMYRNQNATKVLQPFTVDQLRQDFLKQMQRRKELELLSSSLQQGRRGGLVGLNMAGGAREGGGVLVGGGLMSGVSDPVAAIKMHYAKTEQYGSNIREDESWRRSSR